MVRPGVCLRLESVGGGVWFALRSDKRTRTDLGPNRSGRFAVRSVHHHGSRLGCMVYRQFEASGSPRRGKWHRNGSRLPNKMKIFRVRDEKKKRQGEQAQTPNQESSDSPPFLSPIRPRCDTVLARPELFTQNASHPRLAKDSRATLDGLHGRGFWGYSDSLRAAD
ncbi:hypothetical protein LY76DRAFT_371656 [Colletotrichum caudatum]|nr:hypothetical protein LY76DRAFT_371656 [Colletotrichum caudatum]